MNNTNKLRELRNNMTSQEKKFWDIVRNRQFYGRRFLRQYPIGNYIVDFVCRKEQIIIEIDGGQHNQEKDVIYDKIRTEYFERMGFKVVRFWNNEIDNNIEGVYLRLKEVFKIQD